MGREDGRDLSGDNLVFGPDGGMENCVSWA
jgi:hypothetical protein